MYSVPNFYCFNPKEIDMPKGFPKRADELTPIEGGGGGSGRKGLLTDMSPKAALTALGSTVAAPTAFLVGSAIKRNKEIDAAYEAADKKREAAAEMKRESRGFQMNTREQYEYEKEAGDPNAVRLSFEEWKNL